MNGHLCAVIKCGSFIIQSLPPHTPFLVRTLTRHFSFPPSDGFTGVVLASMVMVCVWEGGGEAGGGAKIASQI